MKSKKFLLFFFLIIFVIQIFQVLYFNRFNFSEKYDVSYWKDRFEHSQWQLPLSKRIIGDDGIFSYVGYRLVQGDDPSKNNPETAPVGKYLIGISIALFNNPIYYSLFFGLLSLVTFFFIAKKLLKDITLAIFVTTILLLDPLFFTQFWKSWVDIAQLFFLLLNVLFLILLNERKNNRFLFSLISGLSLGLFLQTKLPILFPLIYILESIIFLKNKLLKEYSFYFFGIIFGTILPYFQYFILGHSLLDFIKLEKYILSFYTKSQLSTNFGSILGVLLFGKFQSLNQTGFVKILEWWIFWPLSFVVSVFTFLKLSKEKNNFVLKGIGVFIILSLVIFSIIPSYPRYLLLVIPFIYLFLGYFVKKYIKNTPKVIFIIIVSFFGLLNSYLFLLPKPDMVLSDFYYNFSHQFFQDIYKQDILKNSELTDIDKFRFITQKSLSDASVKEIEIKELDRKINLLSDNGFVKVRITYKTQDLGSFTEEKVINLNKESSDWKVKWDWDILLIGFRPHYQIKTNLILGKRGDIISKTGEYLAKDQESYLILINPEKIDTKKENEMLLLVGKLADKVSVRIQNAYLENSLPGDSVPIATINKDISDLEKEKLLSYPGLSLIRYPSRVYVESNLEVGTTNNTFYDECCTRIYSSYSYHGLNGFEKTFDNSLWGYSGGSIDILDEKGKVIRTILKKDAKNGQNVILTL